MAILFQRDVTQIPAAVTVPTTTETPLQTSNSVPLEFNTAKAVILTLINILIGTGTTALVIRVYRGPSIALGLNIAIQTITVTAGQTLTLLAEVVDLIAGLGTVNYTVTVTQTGATANGTVNQCTLDLDILSG